MIKFLLADNDPEASKAICDFLTNDFNAEVVLVSSGEEALYEIVSNKKPFDVILLNIMLPSMNGIETCLSIREQPYYENVPIIFLSTAIEKDLLMNFFYAGGSDFILKPVNHTELQVRTQLALKNKAEHLQALQTIKKQTELMNHLTRSYDELSNRMPFDLSTDLFNRAHMDQLIKQEWLRHKRSQFPLALLLIRIDGLDPELRRNVAATLSSTCRRAADHLGVWNEAQFVALITDSKDSGYHKLAELVSAKMQQQYPSLKCYIGISACIPPINIGDSRDLIDGAKLALEEAYKKKMTSIVYKDVIYSKTTKKAS